ncbi:non-ribosomal peptide synthetase [Clostridium tagluense]|uniref:non-ribosomal peptide synthetase n=1 Tax=Clostridium tagluense TaxID=360422 RepID=UPI001C6F2C30|nr:non-ribosomal peptide synthetase [Clostridium tagluense]MBW9155185.1 amino acid adenylation domain-containing protein [Clostridium tagluense]WLC64622.1 amino acid adenylation domain-containing protein [Clostridium tagluense]
MKIKIEKLYPLTPMQEGMLFHSIMDKDTRMYFEQAILGIEGKLDNKVLEETFKILINRYDILRTIFISDKFDLPQQVVLNKRKSGIIYKDLSEFDELNKKSKVKEYLERDKELGFDLSKDVLLRMSVLKLDEKKYKLIISFPHIILDGWSFGIIMNEFLKIYSATRDNQELTLDKPKQYFEYINWIEKKSKKVDDFWKKYLQGYDNKSIIPSKSKNESKSFKLEEFDFFIDKHSVQKLHQVCNDNRVTMNTLMQTVWGIVLQKYNNTNDIVFGFVTAGRNTDIKDIEKMVGLLINTIPVRINSSNCSNFSELLNKIQKETLELSSYEYSSLAQIQSNSQTKNNLIHNLFVFQNYYVDDSFKNFEEMNLGFNICEFNFFEHTNYDFNLVITSNKEIKIKFKYNAEAYKREVIENVSKHFKKIIDQVIKNFDIKLDEIDILDNLEKEKILYEFNDTYKDYKLNRTLQELFEEQVKRIPNNIAVVYENEKITYKELNEKAIQLALVLKNKGIKPDEIVGIAFERSLEMVIAMIGVLKSGGAYLPIDINSPKDRISYILKDSGTKIILTQNELVEKIDFSGDIISIDDNSLYYENINSEAILKNISSKNNLIYTIYTSGSTGMPKGVLIEQKNVMNFIKGISEVVYDRYRNEKLNVAVVAPYYFDMSVKSIYPSLILGHTLFIVPEDIRRDGARLLKYYSDNKIHISDVTPSHIQMFINCEEVEELDLKHLICGGESLSATVVNRFYEIAENDQILITNSYGPTECCVDSSSFLIDKDISKKLELIPIGKPLGNQKIYILDKQMKVLPIGIEGELYISGEGVARGYLNKLDLTKERFVENPFVEGQKMYRTGDLARWIVDGNIEYLGRIDDQVKIRGYRIELGEIENSLLKHKDIKEAVVIARNEKENYKYLCAYITSDKEINSKEIKEYLKEYLPEYMIPPYFTQLEKIPLTTNAKVNKRMLPEPNKDEMVACEYEESRNELEEHLVKIWQDVLGIKKVGINDNFFELGGDSIKSIRIISKLKQVGYILEMKNIFEFPCIKDIVSTINVKENGIEINQDKVVGKAKLTPIQRYFFENNTKEMNHWNQSIMLYGKEGFDEKIIKKVFDKLIIHHDAFRFVYEEKDDEIIACNRDIDSNLYTLQTYELKNESNYEAEIEKLSTIIQSSINLKEGPLVRLGLFKTRNGDHLLIVMHHLVVDGVSWRILLEDFALGYSLSLKNQKINLPKKTNSFLEWSRHLEKYSNADTILKEKEFWNKIESTKIKSLQKDNIVKLEENIVKNCNNVVISLSEEETNNLLRKVNTAYNTEINDILLSALAMSMYQWTGQEKTLISLEGHGREAVGEKIDISRTIGWFTTRYPVVLDVKKSSDLGYVIKSTKEILRKIPNKGIGYGILRYITRCMDNTLNPEINFNYLGSFDQDIKTEIFEISNISNGESVSKYSNNLFAIKVNGMIIDGCMNISIIYNEKEYHETTIKSLATKLKSNLKGIIELCINKDTRELTPSDLDDNELTIEELSNILGEYNYEIDKIYMLSPIQQGILFYSLKDEGKGAYTQQLLIKIKGELDLNLFNEAYNFLIKRHDVLRTIFAYEGVKVPRQIVFRDIINNVDFEDISNINEECKEIYVKQLLQFEKNKGINLKTDLPIRIKVVKFNEASYNIIWNYHHIIQDGWSTGIIVNDFFKIYLQLQSKTKIQLPQPESYKTYISWLKNQNMEVAKDYWKKVLEDYDCSVKIYNEKMNCNQLKYVPKEFKFQLSKDILNKMKKMSESKQVTVNTILQSVWGILLQKYNNTEDVVFGSVVSGRNIDLKNIENMVGVFINTIPVRVKNNNSLYIDLLKEVQENALKSSKYDYYPLYKVQEDSKLKYVLINNIFVFENYYIENSIKEDVFLDKKTIFIEEVQHFGHTNYDFNIIVQISDDKINIIFKYNEATYNEDTIEKISNQFKRVLENVIEKPEIKVSEIDIVDNIEKERILYEFNNTKVEYPSHKTIQDLFEDQVEKTPNNIAVIFEDKKLTYREINEKANQLARKLRNKGVKANSTVGIMIERSPEMIIGIMGILKAGGAYIPIDPSYPKERIEYIFKNSESNILLSTENLLNNIDFNGHMIDLFSEDSYEDNYTNLQKINSCNDMAYVIYTSGTTGNPKGVAIYHCNILNTICWRIKYYDFNKNDVVLQIPSFSFDSSVEDILTALTSGAKLVLMDQHKRLDIHYLKETILINKVTNFLVTPVFYNTLLDQCLVGVKTLKKVTVAGENIQKEVVRKHFNCFKNVRLFNEYGPTENSVCSTIYEIDINSKEVLIGKPVANTKVYILDKSMNIVPIGIAGELSLTGAGLAKGYFKNSELTSEKFIQNPFELDKKMYKTGDLARWLPDGNIEFLGRIDNQVKIRGFRIELEEIENRILQHKNIKETAVIVKQNKNNEQYICAYVVSEKDVAELNLRDYLKKSLPEYMIPSYFIQLQQIPLTINGKLNKKALPDPMVGDAIKGYEAPTNEIEKKLAKVWSEVLGIEKVGINDNFFEIGGDSIKIIKLINIISTEFKKKIKISDIYNMQSVKEMAKNMIEEYDGIKKQNNDEVLLLNKKENKNIFAFPPIIGYGIAYKDLAINIKTHSVYSFDFIESSNRVDKYVDIITRIQPQGSYILLGYSAGGNLAFEVAKELTVKGHKVSNIIMIDSYKKDLEIKMSKEEVDKYVEEKVKNLSEDENVAKYINSSSIQKNVASKIFAYYNYNNNVINDGKIPTNIELLVSEENKNFAKKIDKWTELIGGNLNVYQGVGQHVEMLELKNNIDILIEILKSL